jgi:hypothetical protein
MSCRHRPPRWAAAALLARWRCSPTTTRYQPPPSGPPDRGMACSPAKGVQATAGREVGRLLCINPIRQCFGFCPTATAFSGDLQNASHTNSLCRCGRRKGGFGFTPEPPFRSNDAPPPHLDEIDFPRLSFIAVVVYDFFDCGGTGVSAVKAVAPISEPSRSHCKLYATPGLPSPVD